MLAIFLYVVKVISYTQGMHMEAKVCNSCTVLSGKKRKKPYVLVIYMGNVVCASFALICCSVVQVEENRDV